MIADYKKIKRYLDTIFVLCLVIIYNLILATLRERVRGKGERQGSAGEEGHGKGEGRNGGGYWLMLCII